MPEVKKVGSIKFQDFIEYVRDNWNFHEEYKTIQDFNYLERLVDSESFDNDYISRETADKLLNIMNIMVKKVEAYKIDTYFEILSEFYTLDYKSDSVQLLIRLLHKFIIETLEAKEDIGAHTRDIFARMIIPGFMPGNDLYLIYEKKYGAHRCRFIAEAIAYYGGYDRIDDMEDETNG